jgi:predicted kinase
MGPGSLAIPGLAADLRRLYSGAGAIEDEAPLSVAARVLDSPLDGPGTTSSNSGAAASAADATVALSTHDIRHLCLHSGASVVLSNVAATPARRSCRAAVVAAAADEGVSAHSHDAEEGSTTAAASQPELGLPPLLAYNLGLLYQLQPFLQDPADDAAAATVAAAGSKTPTPGAAPPPPPFDLQLAPTPEHHIGGTGRPIHAAAAAAAAVTICKVPQPSLDPLLLVGDHAAGDGAGGGSGGSAGAGGAADGAAAAGSSQQQKQQEEQQRAIQNALQHHFTSAPRYVAVGDVIGVLLPAAAAAGQLPVALSSAAGGQPSPVYFRVTEVKPPVTAGSSDLESNRSGPLRIDPQTTALMLEGGSSRVALPVGFVGFATGQQGQHVAGRDHRPLLGVHASAAWHPAPGLPGVCGPLLPAWRQLARTVAPLLHPAAVDVRVRAAVLLHGPRGSGKQTAARAVAAALGMNHIAWSCHEIRVSSAAVGCLIAVECRPWQSINALHTLTPPPYHTLHTPGPNRGQDRRRPGRPLRPRLGLCPLPPHSPPPARTGVRRAGRAGPLAPRRLEDIRRPGGRRRPLLLPRGAPQRATAAASQPASGRRRAPGRTAAAGTSHGGWLHLQFGRRAVRPVALFHSRA